MDTNGRKTPKIGEKRRGEKTFSGEMSFRSGMLVIYTRLYSDDTVAAIVKKCRHYRALKISRPSTAGKKPALFFT